MTMKRLITTGGTIDKVYNPLSGEMAFDGMTYVPAMFQRGRYRLDEWEFEALMQVDSLEMTDGQREAIARRCLEVPELRILITHGTDTMTETAQLIKRTLLRRGLGHRTIVLTGAMIPYNAEDSDALVNLGAAVERLNNRPTGVWVTMNGQTYEADQAIKDKTLGIFRARTSEEMPAPSNEEEVFDEPETHLRPIA